LELPNIGGVPMSVIYLLIPISLLFAGGFLWAFIWAVRSGQYDDTSTPSMRVVLDDAPPKSTKKPLTSKTETTDK